MGYDAHMNLIMRDISEQYTVRLRTERTKFVGRVTAGSQASEGDDSAAQSGENGVSPRASKAASTDTLL